LTYTFLFYIIYSFSSCTCKLFSRKFIHSKCRKNKYFNQSFILFVVIILKNFPVFYLSFLMLL